MKEDRRSGSGGGISIGGSVHGSALAVGDHNRQDVRSGAPAEAQADLLAALTELRAALDALSGPHAAAARAGADAAVAQASEPDADPSAIGAALEMALGAAKKTAEFGEVAARFAPALAKIGGLLATFGVPFVLG